MKLDISRAQMVYEVHLRSPVFELAANTVDNVKALYSSFARFGISSKDITVIPSQNLADFSIKLATFNSFWNAEFRFDRYEAQLGDLEGASPELVTEYLEALETAARLLLPSGQEEITRVQINAWYTCEGGAKQIQDYFGHHAPKTLGFEPGFGGATELQFNISGGLTQSDERWSVRFILEPSASPQVNHLYVLFETRYLEGGKFNSLAERKTHFLHLYEAVLTQAGFVTSITGSHSS